MECGAMHFGEFNPLDMLAAAASLQTTTTATASPAATVAGDDTGDGEEDGGGDGKSPVDTDPPTSTPTTTDNTSRATTSVTSFVAPNSRTATLTQTRSRAAMPRVMKVVHSGGGGATINPPPPLKLSNGNLRDPAGKVTVANKDGTSKTLTVVRINKAANPDHSYAVYAKTDRPRYDDDEGYCSRSSLGSPGQCWKSDSENPEQDVFDQKDSDCDPKSPHPAVLSGRPAGLRGPECLSPPGLPLRVSTGKLHKPSAAVLSPPATREPESTDSKVGRRATKIVIVSRDANIHKLFGQNTTDESINTADNNAVELSPTTGLLSVVGDAESVTESRADSSPDVCLDCGQDDQSGHPEHSGGEEQLTTVSPPGGDTVGLHQELSVNCGPSPDTNNHTDSPEEPCTSPATETCSQQEITDTGILVTTTTSQEDTTGQSPAVTDSIESVTTTTSAISTNDVDRQTETLPPVISSGSHDNDHCEGGGTLDAASDSCEDNNVTGNHQPTSPISTTTGEHPVIDVNSTGPDSITVLPSTGSKQRQAPSHKMLQGLLAAGNNARSAKHTQTVLLPAGNMCKLTSAGNSAGLQNLQVVSSNTNNPGKAGVVYLVSSNQSADKSQKHSKKISGPSPSSHGNQYIIQDDIPPVSKFVSPDSGSVKSNKPTTKLCAVQPRGLAPKDSNWVVIKSGLPGQKGSNLVTMGPAVRGVVPGNCTMVPLLVSGSHKPRSLLPLAAKLPVTNKDSLKLSTEKHCRSILDKTAVNIQPKQQQQQQQPLSSASSATTTVAIPNSLPSPASLVSSQKLSGAATSSQDELVAMTTTTTYDDDATAPELALSEPTDALDDTSELISSGTATPLTPVSGRTTPAYEGRMTPLGFTSSSSDSTPSPGAGKINIKISGGVVVDVQQEKGSRDAACIARRSIGEVGSLTWQGMSNLPPSAINLSAKPLPTTLTTPALGQQSRAKLLKPLKSEAVLQLKKRKRPKLRLKTGNPSKAELFRMRECAQNISELHPLIDHDYCTFTEFSADIQSCIIATTESKIKTDKKTVKKPKAARTKSLDDLPSSKPLMSPESPKLKKRKYTKRKLSQLLQRVSKDDELDYEPVEDLYEESLDTPGDSLPALPYSEVQGKKLKDRGDRKPKRRYRPRNSGDKNYVKIPGSYQDQFVYYATKKNRGRPRKFEGEPLLGDYFNQSLLQQTNKPFPNTNISEFEWYKEMARIDKGTKFGVELVGAKTVVGSPSVVESPSSAPIHESEVVDMVMEMSDMMPTSDVTSRVDSRQILGDLMHTDEDTRSVASMNLATGEMHEDSNSSALRPPETPTVDEEMAPPTQEGTVDASLMAEFHRLLNSMEESDLKMLTNLNAESQGEQPDKKDSAETNDGLKEDGVGTLNNLNAYLGSYSQDSSTTEPSLSQPSTSQFLDLDDINDSDLLNSGELGSINAIFSDLAPSSSTGSSSVPSSGVMSTAVLDSPSKMAPSQFVNFADVNDSYSSMGTVPPTNREQTTSTSVPGFGKPLDKTELFPDISAPTTPTPPVEFSGAPELTLVNMYWNDLPGLLVNGQEYVRLVDIHKQVLPAKDTGILKKRCQMMGLDIRNCSELQRDFLIRYMNAAKSKSCVIVQKEAAKTLIGFYVDPRPRTVNKQTSEDSQVSVASTVSREEEALTTDTESVPTEPSVPLNVCVEDPDHKKSSGPKGKSWTMYDHSRPRGDQKGHPKSPGAPAVVKIPRPRAPRPSPIRSRSLPETKGVPSSPGTPTSAPPHSALLDIKRSARLKNKKVQYAALHSGVWDGDAEDSDATPPRAKVPRLETDGDEVTLATVVAIDGETVKQPPIPTVVELSNEHPVSMSTVQQQRHHGDELELRQLITKQRNQNLGQKDKRRIRRLREKILRREELRLGQDEARRLKERRDKWLRNVQAAKLKRHEEKYSREHCYAAAEAAAKETVQETVEVTPPAVDDQTYEVVLSADTDIVLVAEEEEEEVAECVVDSPDDDATVVIPAQQAEVMDTSAASPALTEQQDQVEEESVVEPGVADINTTQPEELPSDTPPQTLAVVHRDTVQRSHRGRIQEGTLHMDKYTAREAPCISCKTCREWLSVRRFLKHRHHLNNPDELVEINIPQKLDPAESSDAGGDLWSRFTQQRIKFASNPAVRSRRPAGRSAPRSTSPVKRTAKGAAAIRKHSRLLEKKENLKGAVNRTPPPSPELTPGGSVRHSSRPRKQKQFHPMESYVFGQRPEGSGRGGPNSGRGAPNTARGAPNTARGGPNRRRGRGVREQALG